MVHFHELYPSAKLYGTDIDEWAIHWCRDNLDHACNFTSNKQWPPLSYRDGFFDLVYSVSVFTHLPEDMQFAWLAELRRVAKEGSYLLLTTHNMELLPANFRSDEPLKAGFYYSMGTGTDGLPDFYQTSFHSEEYIFDKWGKFFRIVRVIKKGIGNHQDLVICRR